MYAKLGRWFSVEGWNEWALLGEREFPSPSISFLPSVRFLYSLYVPDIFLDTGNLAVDKMC